MALHFNPEGIDQVLRILSVGYGPTAPQKPFIRKKENAFGVEPAFSKWRRFSVLNFISYVDRSKQSLHMIADAIDEYITSCRTGQTTLPDDYRQIFNARFTHINLQSIRQAYPKASKKDTAGIEGVDHLEQALDNLRLFLREDAPLIPAAPQLASPDAASLGFVQEPIPLNTQENLDQALGRIGLTKGSSIQEGGFGAVCRGSIQQNSPLAKAMMRNGKLPDRVAIKYIHPTHINVVANQVYGLEGELLGLCIPNHPGLIQTYAIITQTENEELRIITGADRDAIARKSFANDKIVAVVSELFDHEDLYNYRETSRSHQTSNPKQIFINILQALQALHASHIAHRDLKLENVLCDRASNEVKLIDYGFLIQLSDTRPKTLSFKGTHEYLASEIWPQIGGKGYDHRVDVWAAAILQLTLAHGIYLFHRETAEILPQTIQRRIASYSNMYPKMPLKILRRDISQRIEWLKKHYKPVLERFINTSQSMHIPDNLLDLIYRALDPNPETRITIDEMLNHPYCTEATGAAGGP